MGVFTFKIYTLGCKVNQYDSSLLNRKLAIIGGKSVAKNSQMAIINTCAVTKTAVRKCRQMVNKARQENPGAKIIITGCWPKAYNKDVEMLKVDLVFLGNEYDKLIKKISNFQFPISNLPVRQVGKISKFKFQNPSKRKQNWYLNNLNHKSRYFIKIRDGCEQFCSYCIIPYTRGKLRSRGKKEIIAEIKSIANSGIKEIVLCGIHLGLYGNKKGDLLGLIKKIIKIDELERVRLSSIEINEVNEKLIKLIATEKRLCNHLHIPLQSGSDKILRLMNWPYSIKNYELQIKNIRKVIPEIALSTDIIVGFPGETEKDFVDTTKFIKKIGFSRLHIFPFSAHEKTKAANFSGVVNQIEIARRAQKLRVLGEQLKNDYEKKFYGQTIEILAENYADGFYYGKSEYYFAVQFNNALIVKDKKLPKNRIVGNIVKVKLPREKY